MLGHVEPTVLLEETTFIMGTHGSFRVSLRLSDPSMHWDGRASLPSVRVSVPPASGITLDPETAPSTEAEHVLGISGADSVASATFDYAVSSRGRAKSHTMNIDIVAPLHSESGTHFVDHGRSVKRIRVDTPLRTKLTVLAVIAVAVFLFIVEWVRVDVVAVAIMVSLPLLNLIDSRATFSGLSSNAVIAIVGVMIISAGLNRAGLVVRILRPVLRVAGASEKRLMICLSVLIAAISSVMQNTGAAVLFLPGVRQACRVNGFPISRILMPIGMCAILGGTMTMIGTSPLILLNDILPDGMKKFGLLELTPIGAAMVVGGIAYFSTGGAFFLRKVVARQMREARTLTEEEPSLEQLNHVVPGPFEIHVPDDWEPEEELNVIDVRRRHLVNVVALARRGELGAIPPERTDRIRPGHVFCAYGLREHVERFTGKYGFELLEKRLCFRDQLDPSVVGTIEAVVAPQSQLVDQTIYDIHFRRTFDVTTLALYREGKVYYREKSDIPLRPGDSILLHGTWADLGSLNAKHRNFFFTAPLRSEVQAPSTARVAVLWFLLALALMLVSSFHFRELSYNPIPLSVCLMLGAVGMVTTGVLSMHEAYLSVDWRTVFLLGGLIPLGMAVDRTGTAEWIARGVVGTLGDSVTPLVLLTVLAVMSGTFCLVISNVGACTLLVPLGASMAEQIGIDPRVAAIVVGLGVSNSFLLPTHQVNALYMGPGGYRTKDYMRVGGVMSVIYVVILVAMTYLFYL
jgi:di/tricarboxylate transporter